MRTLFFTLFIMLSLLQADSRKFVVDLTTGDLSTFESRFLAGVPGNIRYFLTQGDTVDVAVVIHGDAYKFFIADLEESPYRDDDALKISQKELLDSLKEMVEKYGIKMEMCRVGMKRKQIQSKILYPFVTPIASATSGLIRWQNEGYAYIPIP